MAPKEAVSLRLDPVVLARFKATGKGWRLAMAAVLEEADADLIERVRRERTSALPRPRRAR